MTKYFTVKTVQLSGLTDQLATQFSRLYSLGSICQYEYIYTPFFFPRSHGYTLKESSIRKLEKFIFFTFPWLYDLQFIQKSINKVFKYLYILLHWASLFKRDKDKKITNFLGFYNFENQISDNKFNKCEILKIDLYKILVTNEITDIYQLKGILECIASSPSLIYEFYWSDQMYHMLPKLDYLLTKSGVDSLEFTNRKLSENYWKESQEKRISVANFSNKKVNLVAHIRLGDSVALHLSKKTLYVIGDSVYITDNELEIQSLEEIFDVDPNRRPISIQEYEIVLNKIFSVFGRDKISCNILSDGYERTFNTILNALTQGKLKLSNTELQELKHAEKALNDDLTYFLNNYSNTSIVGESFDKFLKSIHTLASSELVIWGTGGFAFYTHKLFKKDNQLSSILHITNDIDEVLQEINTLRL